MSTMNKEKLKGLQSFLKDDIWRVTEDEVSKSRGILYNAIKSLLFLFVNSLRDVF